MHREHTAEQEVYRTVPVGDLLLKGFQHGSLPVHLSLKVLAALIGVLVVLPHVVLQRVSLRLHL